MTELACSASPQLQSSRASSSSDSSSTISHCSLEAPHSDSTVERDRPAKLLEAEVECGLSSRLSQCSSSSCSDRAASPELVRAEADYKTQDRAPRCSSVDLSDESCLWGQLNATAAGRQAVLRQPCGRMGNGRHKGEGTDAGNGTEQGGGVQASAAARGGSWVQGEGAAGIPMAIQALNLASLASREQLEDAPLRAFSSTLPLKVSVSH